MLPLVFSNIITSIIIISIGVSVLFKNRNNLLNRSFFIYSISISGYFIVYGILLSVNSPSFYNLRFAFAVIAGFTASWFFRIFLFGKGINSLSRIYLLLTFLTLLILIPFPTPYNTIQARVIPISTIFHAIISVISVLSSIFLIHSKSKSKFVKKRLSYLGVTSSLFFIILFLSETDLTGPVSFYIGHIATIIYSYFLGETILKRRFMDFNETLTRIGALVGIVSLISLVYWSLLFWIPEGSGEFLALNLFVGSFIVIILIDPFEKIVAKWIKLLFKPHEELERSLNSLSKVLDNIHESDLVIGTIVTENLKENSAITDFCIFFMNEDQIVMKSVGTNISSIPDQLQVSQNKPFFDRLMYQPYISKDEIEQELDRLKRGWSISPGVESLQSVIDTLDTIKVDYSIPILSQERFSGFLGFADRREGALFNEEEINSFREIAKKIGYSLMNSVAFKQAREKDRLAVLGQLSSGLAHEIRNPLGAINGAAQLLMDDSTLISAINEEQEQFLNIISEESQRLNKVVSTFLEFARFPQMSMKKIEINNLFNKTIPVVKTSHPKAKIEFSCTESSMMIFGDKDKLRQLILNIVMNAIQAIEDNQIPEVQILCSKVKSGNNEFLRLQFKDNGTGIEPSVINSVFEPFYTTKTTGTGLGLAICKKIVQSHGGSIKITDSSPNGTTIEVDLPLFKTGTNS